MLADVAKNARERQARKAAVEKLTDQEVLAEVATSDIAACSAAIPKLADQTVPAPIVAEKPQASAKAQQPNCIGVRFDIGKIHSAGYGEECWKVFWKAVHIELVAGSELLEGDTKDTPQRENVYCLAVKWGMTGSGRADDVRKALKQSEEYRTVAAHPDFIDEVQVRREPLVQAGRVDLSGKIVGESYRALPALSAVRPPVGTVGEAQERVMPEARKDLNAEIRRAATRKLTDQTILAGVATHDRDASVRGAAVEKLTDQAFLADVARTCPDANTCIAALRKLTDQVLLAEIARSNREPSVRVAAAIALTDRTVLAQVARTCGEHQVLPALISELVRIGRTGSFQGDSEGALRTVTIGRCLDALGGGSLMYRVATEVVRQLGPFRQRDLDNAWDGIGTWRS